jgi:hypothetical protein
LTGGPGPAENERDARFLSVLGEEAMAMRPFVQAVAQAVVGARGACTPRFAVALAAGVLLSASAHGYTAFIDTFQILRTNTNAGPATLGGFFFDDFTGSGPPPSAPNFLNGSPASYGVLGTFPPGAEAGGKLALDTDLGAIVLNATGQPRQVLRATLQTTTFPPDRTGPDPGGFDPGLYRHHEFQVSGRFDLAALPNAAGQLFGIEVNDDFFDPTTSTFRAADERLQVQIQRASDPADTTVYIALVKQVFSAGTLEVLNRQPLPAPPASTTPDQIAIGLGHLAGTGTFAHGYRYFQNGAPLGDIVTLPGAATMFAGENFVRAAFVASQVPIPEPGTYAMLLAGLAMLGWVARRRMQR